MDHTHCFLVGGELTHRVSQISHIRDSDTYGLFPEFRPFLNKNKDAIRDAIDTLRGIPRNEVEDAVQSIPPDWLVDNRAKAALAEFLTARAAYVAEHIMDWIWPQVEFDFMNEAEDHS